MGSDDYEAKVKRNEELRAELLQLNKEIDDKLRNKGVAVKGKVKTSNVNPLYDSPVHRENERVKRENARLLKKLRENTCVAELQHTRDLIAEKQKQIDEVKTLNHALEQVTRHQSKGLEQVQRLENEVDSLARCHAEDLLKLKDELREERQARDDVQKQVTANQQKIANLKQRIAAAKQPIAEKWTSIDQLKDALSAKEAVMQEMQESVDEAKRTNGNDEELKQLRREHREQVATTQKLKQSIASLRQEILETDKVLKMSATPHLWKYADRAAH
eukprot:TRINITY_DN30126_c0_g1_i1.p3 TRINITY_DN30126_c0_g1~~TRINITY_DN30126_c0_g1_i1.p3  ORF type:complete len:274 (+),score=145.41 TRINITY_DN30126_c0_g1_i1:118-939(+)